MCKNNKNKNSDRSDNKQSKMWKIINVIKRQAVSETSLAGAGATTEIETNQRTLALWVRSSTGPVPLSS